MAINSRDLRIEKAEKEVTTCALAFLFVCLFLHIYFPNELKVWWKSGLGGNSWAVSPSVGVRCSGGTEGRDQQLLALAGLALGSQSHSDCEWAATPILGSETVPPGAAASVEPRSCRSRDFTGA